MPTTYGELIAAAEALVDAGIAPMALGGSVDWHVMRLLDALIETKAGAAGADALTQGGESWADNAAVDAAFIELERWGNEFLVPGFMAMSHDDAAAEFNAGRAAMTIEGDWFGGTALAGGLEEDNVGLFPFPTGTGRTYSFGELFYMTPNAGNPEAAAKFLDFMISPEGQGILGTHFGAVSVNYTLDATDAPFVDQWLEIIGNSHGVFVNNDQNFSTAETTEFWRIQNSVLTGGIDPLDAGTQFPQWRDARN